MSDNGFNIQSTERANLSRTYVEYSRILDDRWQALFSDPTPQKIKSILDRVDNGEYSDLPMLAMEIERKDSQIKAMAFTRRNSLFALEWEVVPNEEAEDEALAEEAAVYCYEQLGRIANFRQGLRHLLFALTWGVSGLELIWESNELIDMVPVPFNRWTAPISGKPEFRLQTEGAMVEGIPMPWGKFVVWVPDQTVPYPLGCTLVHGAAKIYSRKHYVLCDWSTFMDRVADAKMHATKEEGSIEGTTRTNLEQALSKSSVTGWIITDNGIKIETITGDRSVEPYVAALNYLDNQLAKLYLGQTLTSDVGSVGSFAAAKIHDNVRADILQGDLIAEADNIEMNILKPMVMMRYPGREVPVPQWKRKIIEAKNVEAERLQLEKIREAIGLGLPLPTRWTYEALDIPIPADVEIPEVIFTKKEAEKIDQVDDGDPQAPADNEDVSASIRDTVLSAIDRSWLNTKQIMQVTKLAENQVTGVLTDRKLVTKIQKRKSKGKLTEYRKVRPWR